MLRQILLKNERAVHLLEITKPICKTRNNLNLGKVVDLNQGIVSKRSFHSTCVSCRFWESNPRGEYKNEKLEEEIKRIQRESLWGFKTGFKDLREEIAKWGAEAKDRYNDTMNDSHLYVAHGDKKIIFKFDEPDSLKNWTTVCDSDHNEGFSRCELTSSPTGKGLFHGFTNTTPPKDGRVKYGGYCIMNSKRPMKSFGRKSYHDWSDYNHLIMRIRGDGRSYMLNIQNAGYYDITWNDSFHYILFTRGGPYWQYVKIPFSKFAFGSKGRIQDMQDRVELEQVSGFQIGATKIDGPFCLEIDWIGLELDETNQEVFAYETYTIPKFIAGV